jgi:hypothetical protein
MAENQSSLQELQGRSQYFTFDRRNFLQGLASVVLPSLACRPQPLTLFRHCKPKFTIGNKVCTSAVYETGELWSEQGEVVGLCWHPKNQQWEYLVFWDDKVFDEQLTSSEDLEAHYA